MGNGISRAARLRSEKKKCGRKWLAAAAAAEEDEREEEYDDGEASVRGCYLGD